MKRIARHLRWPGALLPLIVALSAAGLPGNSAVATVGHARPSVVAPRALPAIARAHPAAATIPATTCALTGSTQACDLFATTGALALPGATVPISGYAATGADVAQYPGPTLVVTQGQTISVTLHNGLAEASSLSFPGMSLVPDTTGAAPGATKTYTFTAASPGTFLYEAGPTANGPRQVAMGLFGALIVRPSSGANSAYGATAPFDTSFDDEALVILSEIDPAFNANPAGFTMSSFAPLYRLINGRAYPQTDPISTTAGHKLLIRYLNAGLQDHSIGVLGLRQTVLANDGFALPHTYHMVAETIPAGASLDASLAIPATAPTGAKYSLYDAARHLDNAGRLNGDGTIASGGMLALISLPGTLPGGGPVTSNVRATPNPATGATSVTLSANVGASGGANVTAAEYFIDNRGANGSGAAMAGSFGAPAVAVNATLSTADLAALSGGSHTLYVHGQDSTGTWGAFASVVLNLDKVGPATNGVTLSPNPTNGAASVALRATGDDTASGGANVTAAEYFIDTAGSNGTGTSLALNAAGAAPLAGFNGTIAAATVAALPEGTHTVYVHSQDAAGNWGAFATIILNVDKTAPAAANLSVAPNPNNGTLSFDPNRTVVKVSATIGDPVSGGVQSGIKVAEGFLDAAGPNGSGFQTFVASDGVFNSSTEGVYALIPLSGIQALSQGPHTFYVHGRDAAGNWGPLSTVVLTVDKTGPAVTNVTGTPNPTNGATSVTLNATATDPANAGPAGSAAASSIVAAEWFRGADPGAGNGTAMTTADGAFNSTSEGVRATIDVGGLSFGNYTIFVRAKDAAGNWGPVASATLNVLPADALFANSFESGNFSAWTAATGATIGVNTAAVMGRDGGTRGMQATINGTTPTGYVTDGTPNNEASYHARFYFNPHSTSTNAGAQDVFAGQNTAGTTILRMQYRRTALGAYQIRTGALQQSATTPTAFTAWITVSNAAHAIEVAWQAGANGRLTLYIDGTSRATLSNLATSATTYRLDAMRLGPSSGSGSGTEYFDAFVSTRTTYIGQ